MEIVEHFLIDIMRINFKEWSNSDNIMVWKGREEFIKAGNKIVWAGLLLFAIGLLLTIMGGAVDLLWMYIISSLQAFGVGFILIGSAVFLVGRLKED